MITEKQTEKVIELLKQRIPKSTIAKQESISRTTVSKILKKTKNSDTEDKEFLQDKDIESLPEIIRLKKELREAELKKQIREVQQPLEIEKKFEELQKKIEIRKSKSIVLYKWVNKIDKEIKELENQNSQIWERLEDIEGILGID